MRIIFSDSILKKLFSIDVVDSDNLDKHKSTVWYVIQDKNVRKFTFPIPVSQNIAFQALQTIGEKGVCLLPDEYEVYKTPKPAIDPIWVLASILPQRKTPNLPLVDAYDRASKLMPKTAKQQKGIKGYIR